MPGESEMETVDESYMRHCLQLAEEAKRNGKIAVGSLIVLNNRIIAEGSEGDEILPSPLGHAEMIAVIKALETLDSKKLSGCTLYTTVEPCVMCSYLIRSSGISRVVYGTIAGQLGGATSDHPILSSANIPGWGPISVEGGVLADDCAAMLRND